MSQKIKLVIKNLEQVVQVCSNGELFKKGDEQDNVALIERKPDNPSTGSFVAIDSDGKIAAIGHDSELDYNLIKDAKIVDGKGCCIIPGFVDAHTHSVWSGDRLFEFDLKMAKPASAKNVSMNSYLDIHKSGGGIYFTVDHTTESSEVELEELLVQRIDNFLSCGTTTVEIKTGYGLDFETELKQLKVIQSVKEKFQNKITIVTTLLPAHAVPKGMTAEEGTNKVIEILNQLKNSLKNSTIQIDLIDAFCEKGVYDVDQCKRIFLHAQKLFPSTSIGFHGEELSNLDSPLMAAEINAKHVSHLECISTQGMEAVAKKEITALLLPTTAYLLRLEPPPVREMIDTHGVIVALGSDFNPNAYCYSMAQVMLHAVIYYRMTLNEALVAATINAANAINKSKQVGSIEVGKDADLIMIKTDNWKRIIYQMGESKDLIKAVIKNGQIVKGSF